jgi:hypothetical protein
MRFTDKNTHTLYTHTYINTYTHDSSSFQPHSRPTRTHALYTHTSSPLSPPILPPHTHTTQDKNAGRWLSGMAMERKCMSDLITRSASADEGPHFKQVRGGREGGGREREGKKRGEKRREKRRGVESVTWAERIVD